MLKWYVASFCMLSVAPPSPECHNAECSGPQAPVQLQVPECQGLAQNLQQASLKRCSRLLACVWCHMASSVETASASLGSRFLQSSAQLMLPTR